MSKGLTGVNFEKHTKNRGNGLILRGTLVLSIIAIALVFVIVLTIISSNNLMNIESNQVSNVPSNILPSYSTCSFESFDKQTSLSGWFFKVDRPITTVIFVHDSGSNRLPFGVNMIDMIERMLDANYNVFLFDLRNSGDSGGDITGYGYLEWQDVLGAIAQVRMISVTTDVILFGIGSGTTACLMAYDQLPAENLTDAELAQYSDDITSLGFNRSYVKGMIFDSPAKNSDDYIKPLVVQSQFLGNITQNFVPYAIRVSSGVSSSMNLAAQISRLPIPVCIIYGGHDIFVGSDKIQQIINERNRLNSSITSSLMIPGAGYLESYRINKDLYIDTVMSFLQSFFI